MGEGKPPPSTSHCIILSPEGMGVHMLKFLGGTIGVIFLIGLAVVVGLFMLIF